MGDVKQRQRQAWAAGDYRTAGARIQIVSEMLCEAVDLRGGQTVLDVATGTGNTAIAAARRWCEVAAIDYVPSLLEIGRVRAAAEGVPVAFLEGDAEEIGFPDNAFDVVLSTFGSMFAPNHEKAADELIRVCRPGGKIGMANWTPTGFGGAFFWCRYATGSPSTRAETSKPLGHGRSFAAAFRRPRHLGGQAPALRLPLSFTGPLDRSIFDHFRSSYEGIGST